ncbi:DUF4269 domain-containing protein [Brevibacillus laterosporus]|uniref:DUF4269 domain-containing protein n=1 Tax=Brevibacillus laterosporus TaxID=1465 RepID=A0A502IIG4_BRELA|nr:DUF4269 domain-containing protein [Brevibacillus laterosporus]QDX91166.1 DUF4269 domain-containing protein [Brevibacillus laterosporus]RAP28101.1 hypothetical protein C2W64_00567 [Brevibacillus laterosporus]TPG69568.1 DUF4269 domain-containing protein [Brevibacillus laterosporus]TPG86657.1 DUF4269 domain-containing protein [Brevibacillus laterosporus]
MIHLDKPDYLQIGNDRQKQAFIVLQELELFNQLSIYDPVLTGTIPLGIDIATSDLDIICQVGCSEFDQFTHEVVNLYGDCADFQLEHVDELRGGRAIVLSFSYQGWLIEIFGQSIPVRQQNAYRHMIVEERMLRLAKDSARTDIRLLKEQGYKTEPAFVYYFQLGGEDPYDRMLQLYDYSDIKLLEMMNSSKSNEGSN